jgi:hypothetical protein
MTKLELYRGDVPVVVDGDAIIAIVNFATTRGEGPALLEKLKPFEAQLSVNESFLAELKSALEKSSKPVAFDKQISLEQLFQAIAAIDAAKQDAPFLAGIERNKGVVEAGPDLVNAAKTFLHDRLGAEEGLVASEGGTKVSQVVESPPGATTCFPRR